MARKIRDARIDSRDARERLKVDHVPVWKQIEPGLFLGYRKGSRGGVWFTRRLVDGRYKVKRLGTANDNADANGINILDYAQAQRLAMGNADAAARIEATGARPGYTVGEALADYMQNGTKCTERA